VIDWEESHGGGLFNFLNTGKSRVEKIEQPKPMPFKALREIPCKTRRSGVGISEHS
jgi:hypothetical protein